MDSELSKDEQAILAGLILHPVYQKAHSLVIQHWMSSLGASFDGNLNIDSQRHNQTKGFSLYPQNLRNLCFPASIPKPVHPTYNTPPEGAVTVEQERIERESP